ncbi:polyisoprenoid-binding protein YceI [Tamaricihabitans halophyticus]|uniref:Polyisoprenoid-binding protein YceI n=1 Tax=Tamaricihabitans halophyticus TaxID=1262583 RepID=A0A4R2Q4Q1_9PSEU|nr:YceI family protein [Tamaricihabitans halophyticus]TCP41651.1 polyisoprenoid-binding protein YceI [Tamaricihabitans halophyticus]
MTTATQIPGYTTGTWTIDPAHSDVTFTVRHLGVSKVRGRFADVAGEVITAENPFDSSVHAVLKTASIDTNNEQRDAHVRTEEFLHTEAHPELTFQSTGIKQNGEDYVLSGELTIRGITRTVDLEVELGGFAPEGPAGQPVLGLSASTEINRKDFGVTGGAAGAMLGEKIKIELDIEATKN